MNHQVATDPTNVTGRRIVAAIIDWLIIAVTLFIAFVATVESEDVAEFGLTGDEACDRINDSDEFAFCTHVDDTIYVGTNGDLAAISLIPLGLALLNHVVLEGVTGGSIGKQITGLRVVKQADGSVVGVGGALVRWVLWIVDGIPYCVPLVGLILVLVTTGHRRIGDMAAKTLVVGRQAVGIPPVVPGLAGQPAAGAWAPPPPGGDWATPPAGGDWAPAPPTPGGEWAQPPQAPPPPGAPPAADTGWTMPPSTDWAAPPAGTAEGSPEGSATSPEPEALSPVGPPTAPPEPSAPEAASTPQPGVDEPMWDEARGTYIQWDPKLQQWMQWDDGEKRWTPIT